MTTSDSSRLVTALAAFMADRLEGQSPVLTWDGCVLPLHSEKRLRRLQLLQPPAAAIELINAVRCRGFLLLARHENALVAQRRPSRRTR